jgi:hypothetical protein
MHNFFQLSILAVLFLTVHANLLAESSATANPAKDSCPKDEYACLDVINSSQCIEQLIIEKQAPVTKDALVKCVETEGTASSLPGAVKVSIERSDALLLWGKEVAKESSTVDVWDAIIRR